MLYEDFRTIYRLVEWVEKQNNENKKFPHENKEVENIRNTWLNNSACQQKVEMHAHVHAQEWKKKTENAREREQS